MSEKQLNDLPEKLLLRVFEKMDFKTLMESSLVCKKWNEMIGQSSVIMKKFKLVVNIRRRGIELLPEEFTRKYRSIRIYESSEQEDNWQMIFKTLTNCSKVRNVEIIDSTIKIEDIGDFNKVLSSFTKLEKLSISNTTLNGELNVDLSRMNRLKSLDLNDCRILKVPEKTIKQLNTLPEEILLEVFKKMDHQTLLRSSFVCKKWKEMIGENSAIMEKIELVVNSPPYKIRRLPEKFTRKYQTIKIHENYGKVHYENYIGKLLEGQSSNLKHLDIKNCQIKEEDLENFRKLIASLTKLETLYIMDLEWGIDLSQLDNLKSLQLYKCRVLKFPETAQLTSLKINFLKHFDPCELISFLANQKSLEELSIRCLSVESNNINLDTLKKIQFPLKRLSLSLRCNLFGSDQLLLLFMSKFANSLEELDVGYGFPASLYEMIFNKFRKLSCISIDNSPQKEIFLNLPPILSVRKLTICAYSPDFTLFEGFISKLPNIHTLVISSLVVTNQVMMFIANNFKMVKNLHVNDLRVFENVFDGMNIPSLKCFKINKLDSNEPQVWKEMTKALPNIEEFEVELFVDIFEEFCYEIRSIKENVKIISEGWPQLKHAKFGKGFVASKEIFAEFLDNCKALKTVEIYENAFQSEYEKEEILRDVKRDGFQFIIRKSENE